MSSAALRIGIAGLGTVGIGTLQILRENAAQISQRSGRPIEVVAASARDLSKPRSIALDGLRLEADARALSNAADVDVVVEVMGGEGGIAHDTVAQAIANKKHVVTANKALIAHHGQALAEAAEAQGVVLAFEAAVAGGIPIIAALRSGLAANRITKVAGILNGTCNYILTSMEKTGRDYADVLAEAASLGYLEADPALDIDGIDAGHKVAILASLAFGTRVNFAQVALRGIREITLRDMRYAAEFGYRIKLLGIAQFDGSHLQQSVSPCLVPLSSPLASIDSSFNAVEVHGHAVGKVMFEGRGAGAGPTGSAVVSDLIAIARGDRYPPFTVLASKLVAADSHAESAQKACYYVRLSLKDEPGVLAEFTRVFGDEKISVRAITQREILPDGSAQVVVLTHETSEVAIARAVAAIGALPVCVAAPLMLRIET